MRAHGCRRCEHKEGGWRREQVHGSEQAGRQAGAAKARAGCPQADCPRLRTCACLARECKPPFVAGTKDPRHPKRWKKRARSVPRGCRCGRSSRRCRLAGTRLPIVAARCAGPGPPCCGPCHKTPNPCLAPVARRQQGEQAPWPSCHQHVSCCRRRARLRGPGALA
jgi:hypothetical protein